MADLLRDEYRTHNVCRRNDWNPGREFIPCVAHVIHNAAIRFLSEMSATPADENLRYDRTEEFGGTDRPTANSQHRRFPKLETLSGFARTLEKLRMIAIATTNSTQRGEQFQRIVFDTVGKRLALKLDVKTRWHSTATMLTRALRLRGPIGAWLLQRSELELLILDNREWAQAEMILNILRPFWTAALQLMGGPATISTHLTFALYNYLFDHIDDFTDKLDQPDGHGTLTPARNQLVNGLRSTREFLSGYYSATDQRQTYTASILLNPTIKGSFFETVTWEEPEDPGRPWRTVYEEGLIRMYRRYYFRDDEYDTLHSTELDNLDLSHPRSVLFNSSSPIRKPIRSSSSRLFFRQTDNRTDDQVLETEGPEKEVTQYLAEARVESERYETQQILQYWKKQEERWPHLTIMARDILAVPATGADVERLFSQGRNLVSHHRHNLSDLTIASAMFMKGACSRKRRVRDDTFAADHQRWNDVRVLAHEAEEAEIQQALPDLPDIFLSDNAERLRKVLLAMDTGEERISLRDSIAATQLV